MIAQFARFCVVGLTNTLVTTVCFWALEHAGAPYAPASAVAFAAGALNGFVLNSLWTFRTRGRLAAYVLVQGIGLALDELLLRAWVEGLHGPHLAGQIAVLPFVAATTFVLSRRLAFGAPATSLARPWRASLPPWSRPWRASPPPAEPGPLPKQPAGRSPQAITRSG